MKPTRPKPAKKKEKETSEDKVILSSSDFNHQLSLCYEKGDVDKAKRMLKNQQSVYDVFIKNNVAGWLHQRTHAKKDDPTFLPFAKQVLPSLPEYNLLFEKAAQACVRKGKPKMLMSLYPDPEKGISSLAFLLKEVLSNFNQGTDKQKKVLSFLCQKPIIQKSHASNNEKSEIFHMTLWVVRLKPNFIPPLALEALLGMVSVRQALHILLRDKKDHIPQNWQPSMPSLSQVYFSHLNEAQRVEAVHYIKSQPEFETLLEFIPHLLRHHIKEEMGEEETPRPTQKRKI